MMRVFGRSVLGVAAAGVALAVVVLAPAAVAATPSSPVAVVMGVQWPAGGTRVMVNASVVTQGDGLIVTVDGQPGQVYSAAVSATPAVLGARAVDAAGKVSFTFDTKGLSVGSHRVEVTNSATGAKASADFTVAAGQPGSATGGASKPTEAGDGALAFADSDAIIPLTVLGVILVAGSVAAVIALRARKTLSDV